MNTLELLWQWMHARLDPAAQAWLRESAQRLEGGGSDADVYRSISFVARRIARGPLGPTEAEREAAAATRPGWDPSGWSLQETARVMLLLSMRADGDTWVRRLDSLFATADVGELVAFYQGLPLYPDPPRHVLRAAEGVRSNMKVVFEAVAHRNPYPAEQFDEIAWNQMVLKALFVGSRLDPIVGLDRRANPTLARMLVDYAHERRSAGRPVSPELWRCVGPFAQGAEVREIAALLDSRDPSEQAAAALALARSPAAEAAQALDARADLRSAVTDGRVNWQQFVATP